MKKLKCLLLVLSVLFLTLGFISCGKKEEEPTFNWNTPVVENNIEGFKPPISGGEEVVEINNSVVSMMKENFNKDNYKVLSTSYVDDGVVPVENSAGYVGFYSLHYQKMLIAPQYKSEWLTNYRIESISQLGYLVQITYEDTIVTYDSMGNKVLEIEDTDTYKINPTEITYAMDTTSDISCAQLKIVVTEYHDVKGSDEDEEIEKKSYASYDYATSKCTLKDSLTISQDVVEEEDKYDGPNAGDLYVTEKKIALDDFEGLEGHYLIVSDNVYYIYDANNQVKASYAVKSGVSVIQIGPSLICQESLAVADDAKEKNYDYSVLDNSSYYSSSVLKYKLHTTSVNILTGEVTELSPSYIIVGSSLPYKDENGKAVYSLISLVMINEDKTVNVDGAEYCIVDQNGTILKELTGIPVKNFVQIGDNYYNEVNKIIYSSDLKELAYIGDISPRLDEVNELFIGTLNNKYGAVDYSGKVTIPFMYESLTPLDARSLPTNALIDAKDDFILALRNDRIYKVNIRNGNETFICDENVIEEIEDDLYKITLQNGKMIKYLSQSETYLEIDNTNSQITESSINNDSYTFESKIGNAKYIFMADGKTYNNGTKNNFTDDIEKLNVYTFNVNNFANHDSFTTIGTELTEKIELGRFYGDKIALVEGENKVHKLNGRDYIYATFTATADGEYTFVSDDLSSVAIMDELYEEVIDSSNSQVSAGTKVSVLELEKDKTYVIRIRLSDDYEAITIEKAVEGKYSLVPIDKTDITEGDVKVTLPAGQKYVYVGISPIMSILEYPQYKYTVTHDYTGKIEINYEVTAITDGEGTISSSKTWEMPISPYFFEIVRENYDAEEVITFNFDNNIVASTGTVLNPYVIKASDSTDSTKTKSVQLGYDSYSINGQQYNNIIRVRYLKYVNDSTNSLIINLNIDNTASYQNMDYGCVVAMNGFVTTTDLVVWDELLNKIKAEEELTEEETAEYQRLAALGIIGGAVDADYVSDMLIKAGEGVYVFFMGPQTDVIDVTVTEYAYNTVGDTFVMDNDDDTQKVLYKADKDGYHSFGMTATLIDSTNPEEPVKSDFYNFGASYVIYRADGATYSGGSNTLNRVLLNKGDLILGTVKLNGTLASNQTVEAVITLANEAMPASITFTAEDNETLSYVYTADKDGFVYLDSSATFGEEQTPYSNYIIKYTVEDNENYGAYNTISADNPIYLAKGQQIVITVSSGEGMLLTGEYITLNLAFKQYTASTIGTAVTFEYAAENPVETQVYEYTVAQSGFYTVKTTARKVVGENSSTFTDYNAEMAYGEGMNATLNAQNNYLVERIYLEKGQTVVVEYNLTTSLVEDEKVEITATFNKMSNLSMSTIYSNINSGDTYQLLVTEDTAYEIVLRTSLDGRNNAGVTVKRANGNTVTPTYKDWTRVENSSSTYEKKYWYTLEAGEYTVEFQASTTETTKYIASVYPEVEEYTVTSSGKVFEKIFDKSDREIRINITNNSTEAKYYEINTNLSGYYLKLIKYPGEENEAEVSISNGQIIKLAPGQSIAITGKATSTSTEYKFELVNIYDGRVYENNGVKYSYRLFTKAEYMEINAKLALSNASAVVYRMNATYAVQSASITGSTAENYSGTTFNAYEDIAYIVKVNANTSNALDKLTVKEVK